MSLGPGGLLRKIGTRFECTPAEVAKPMMVDPRETHRYTPYFCEENVWWLAAEMADRGVDPSDLSVLLFTNPNASIAVRHQRAAPPGAWMAWDYHVVLSAPDAGGFAVYDLDSRLPFPSQQSDYLSATFSEQRRLPARWQSLVRRIPGDAYLNRFCSDRSHMLGRLPRSAFPNYPAICPGDRSSAILLAEYRDMTRELDDGSVVLPVDLLGFTRG